jgi:hypothetical protein
VIIANPNSREIRETLLRSKEFIDWQPLLVNPSESVKPTPRKSRTKAKVTPEVTEKHYSVSEVACLWGISTDLVRDIFRKEQGVLKFRRPGTRTKRSYSTIRVPHSVLVRVKESVSR